MFKNLLVPISGDSLTKSEIKMAVKLAKFDGAKITLVYVSNSVVPYSSSEMQSVLAISAENYKKHCDLFSKKLFEKAKKLIGNDIVVNELHIRHPNVSDGIIEAAKKSKADVIAMASHKRTGLNGIFLRSEAHEVILNSKIPVLILS